MYAIYYTKKAKNDIPKLKGAKLDSKTKALIELIRENPYQTPPSKTLHASKDMCVHKYNIAHKST